MPFAHTLVPFLHISIAKLFNPVAMFLVPDIKPGLSVFPCTPSGLALTMFLTVPEHTSEFRPIFVQHFASPVLEVVHPLADVRIAIFVS